MKIGTLKEVKDNENRVGLTPKGIKELVAAGHEVLVQKNAGVNSNFPDEEYVEAGAKIVEDAEEICKEVDILIKVKEPIESEYHLLEIMKGKTIYTYFHLAAVDKKLTELLMEHNITTVAYETVEDEHGRLPLLKPMSEVAGVLAVQYGAQYLQKKYKGRGLTLGVIENTDPANVLVVGAGVVGTSSTIDAAGRGCKVTVLDRDPDRLEELKEKLKAIVGEHLFKNVSFVESDDKTLAEAVKKADLLVGGVLVPGAEAPKIVTEEMVKSMKKGAVIVDVSIDQGGCVFGARSTSHSDPIYIENDVIYCCVTNMPGQASSQSTQALTGATLPYLLKMATMGVVEALKADPNFAKGLNTYKGHCTNEGVAEALELDYKDLNEVL